MSLNSTSTLKEIQAAYADNASYEEDNSVAKARAFVTACRLLVAKLPEESRDRSSSVRMGETLRRIDEEKTQAQAFIKACETRNVSTAGVRYCSFRGFGE